MCVVLFRNPHTNEVVNLGLFTRAEFLWFVDSYEDEGVDAWNFQAHTLH